MAWKPRSTPSESTYSSTSRFAAGYSWRRAGLISTSIGDRLRNDRSTQVIGEIAPVGSVEENDVRAVAGGEPPDAVGAAEAMGGVHRAGGEGFRRRHLQLSTRE